LHDAGRLGQKNNLRTRIKQGTAGTTFYDPLKSALQMASGHTAAHTNMAQGSLANVAMAKKQNETQQPLFGSILPNSHTFLFSPVQFLDCGCHKLCKNKLVQVLDNDFTSYLGLHVQHTI